VCIEAGRRRARSRDMDVWPRREMPVRPLDRRGHGEEVETGLSEADGAAESKRCYLCRYKCAIDQAECIRCNACLEARPTRRISVQRVAFRSREPA